MGGLAPRNGHNWLNQADSAIENLEVPLRPAMKGLYYTALGG
jgi:hypothetical protein